MEQPHMNNKIPQITQVRPIPGQRSRSSEQRFDELETIFHDLGVTFWHTDMSLRLVDSHGMAVAESFHGRQIGEFYREAYGLSEPEAQPLQAHHDARIGMSVTLHYQHGGEQYIMLIEPRRDPEGAIIGTVGMSLRV
jgi:hypothetical protein